MEGIARYRDDHSHPSPVLCWCLAHSPFEQIAEASQARKANLQANIRDGLIAGREQASCALEAALHPVLMWRRTEHGLELPDEVKGRHLRRMRDGVDRQRVFGRVGQEIAGQAQAPEAFVPQEHAVVRV
jgi:hypothetical protein